MADREERTDQANDRFVFPPWTNRLRELSAVLAVGGLLYVIVIVTLVFGPETSAIGYAPEQPVPYSHALHVGELGMDCRYCHSTVEQAGHAAIPPTGVCMNCHATIRAESELLSPVRASAETGQPVPWVRVHDLPDFVYFDHSAHLAAGVGCVECHGRVDRMEVVAQEEDLTMGWCLDCHRDAAPRLRPPDQVTSLTWQPEGDRARLGRELMRTHGIAPSTDCSVCHR